jgi:hypothetical protein
VDRKLPKNWEKDKKWKPAVDEYDELKNIFANKGGVKKSK